MTVYVWRNGALVEKPSITGVNAATYMPDIAGFTTHDGNATVMIESRSQLRAFEQRYGVRQIGDQAKPVGKGNTE